VTAVFAGKSAQATVSVRPRACGARDLVRRLPLKFPAADSEIHPDGKARIPSPPSATGIYARRHPPPRPHLDHRFRRLVDARHHQRSVDDGGRQFGVLTRENASTRKNGIVVLSFEDPAHPSRSRSSPRR